MTLSTGQVLHNRYRIVSRLGQGGFGAVYKAWDTSLTTHRAVKENLDVSPAAQKQFSREARMLAKLNHPNLPRVTDYFLIPDQGQYLVMDFVEGSDLEAMLAISGGPIDEATALKWIGQVCDALNYLHTQNPPIIHRDIKPKNIIITPDEEVKLVDFGIAKIYDPRMSTTLGAKAVTPGFSPPEQYGQGSTDKRSDVYALGATLYTLLTGQQPMESIQRSIGSQLAEPRTVKPGISEITEAVILRAMEIQPSQRFEDVTSFKVALQEATTATVQAHDLAGLPPTVIAPAGTAAYVPADQSVGTLERPAASPMRKGVLSWIRWMIPALVLGITAIAYILIANPFANQSSPLATSTLPIVIQLTPSAKVVIETSASTLIATTLPDTPTLSTVLTDTSPARETPTVTEPTSAIATLSGNTLTRLTFDPAPYYMPSLSPDQRRMVTFAKIGDNYQIVELDPNQGDVIRQVTNGRSDFHHPHFTSDGSRILLAANLGDYFNIYLIDSQTGQVVQQLTDSDAADMTPYWFPDERSFAFMSNRDGDYEIFIGYLDGRPPVQITDNSAYDGTSSVSPDGKSIVYYSNVGGNPDIYLYEIESGSTRQLTTSTARDAEPVFSPDGEWIVFESNRNGNYDIWAIRPDGTGLMQITRDQSHEQIPVFSPDGRWIFFSSTQYGSYDIIRIPWGG